MLDTRRERRARRLLGSLLEGRTSVELGETTRQIEKLDFQEPLQERERYVGGYITTREVARLLRRRAFYRCGHNGKSGLYREPVYSNGG